MTDDTADTDETDGMDQIDTDDSDGPTLVSPDVFESTCDDFDVNGFRKHMADSIGTALDEYVEANDVDGIPDVFFALSLAEIIDEYTSLSAVPAGNVEMFTGSSAFDPDTDKTDDSDPGRMFE